MIVCESALFGVGVLVLLYGNVNLFARSRSIQGRRARLVGFVLMFPFMIEVLILVSRILTFTNINDLTAWMLLSVLGTTLSLGVALALILTAPKRKAHTNILLPTTLTISEAADYLQVNSQDVLRLIGKGDLPAKKIGNDYQIDRDQLIEFISS